MKPMMRLAQAPRQTLAMTPQLMQAIKLLQMSNLEIEAAVREEVDRNPLLTVAPRPGAGAGGAGRSAAAPLPEGAAADPFAAVRRRKSLAEHCREEAAKMPLSDAERAICDYLIHSLEPDGRLAPTAERDAARHLRVAVDDVTAVLMRLQQMEPAGLFARSLQECLTLQLDAVGERTPLVDCLMNNLPLVARRNVKRLAEIAAADEQVVARAIEALRACDPRPGAHFDDTPVWPMEPDVIVTRAADGAFKVALDTTRLPKVLVDMDYHAEVSKLGDQTATRFVADCLRSANWLTRSLDQRARTIVKVTAAIVARQRAFFEGSARHVSPLTLREIADDIEMHESTVSRVVSNKALTCPRGVFALRAFFAVAIDTGDGAISAAAVRAKIRELVDCECETGVRSDDDIVRLLNANGITIARRTVAKYREAMNIPSSVERRRMARQSAMTTRPEVAFAAR